MKVDLSEWVTEVAPRALAYAVSLVRHEAVAEDLVQDCFHRLLAKADDYDLPRDGTRLLFKSITHACVNWTQRRPPTVNLSAVGSPPVAEGEQNSPLHVAMASELAEAVDQALAKLPIDQRIAVELHALGYSTDEAADILDTTAGNARVLRHRGRSQLTAQLKHFLPSE